uniref:tRNA-guanine transglycosylase n=1 Tax=Corynebacterium ulceribovis TaxID=487732 RepID=UPI00058AC290
TFPDSPTEGFTRAYIHHLLKAKESLGGTLSSAHNVWFIWQLVNRMRQAIIDGDFAEFREDFMGRYTAGKRS